MLKVVRPLYGIPERGLHSYLNHLDHHVGRLGITKAKVDPCLLTRHDAEGHFQVMIILLVDDTLAVITEAFMELEEM